MQVNTIEVAKTQTVITLDEFEVHLLRCFLRTVPSQEEDEQLESFAYNLYYNL